MSTAKLTYDGVIYGILSSCCVSLNSIFTKKVLHWVDNSAWTLTFYNNVNASLLFIPLMIICGEIPERVIVTQIKEPILWGLMSIGGICGVSIGFVTAMQIKVLNTRKALQARDCLACYKNILIQSF